MNEKNGKLLDHNYDGIQEVDNHLPRWWVALFNYCILFAILYFAYYELGPGVSLNTSFDNELRLNLETQSREPKNEGLDEKELAAAFKDPSRKEKGLIIFKAKCVACHGEQGQGNIGPNLTDDYWIHGGTLSDIAKTVSVGVLDKGMPPWQSVLTKDELTAVIIFVKTLKGTNPPMGKAPQGILVKE